MRVRLFRLYDVHPNPHNTVVLCPQLVQTTMYPVSLMPGLTQREIIVLGNPPLDGRGVSLDRLDDIVHDGPRLGVRHELLGTEESTKCAFDIIGEGGMADDSRWERNSAREQLRRRVQKSEMETESRTRMSSSVERDLAKGFLTSSGCPD